MIPNDYLTGSFCHIKSNLPLNSLQNSKIPSRPDLLDIGKVKLRSEGPNDSNFDIIKPTVQPEINSPINFTTSERRKAFGLRTPGGMLTLLEWRFKFFSCIQEMFV